MIRLTKNTLGAIAAITIIAGAVSAKPNKYVVPAVSANIVNEATVEQEARCTADPDYNATVSHRPPFRREVNCPQDVALKDETAPSAR